MLAAQAAAEKLNQFKAAARALNITVTEDMDVTAISNAILSKLVA